MGKVLVTAGYHFIRYASMLHVASRIDACRLATRLFDFERSRLNYVVHWLFGAARHHAERLVGCGYLISLYLFKPSKLAVQDEFWCSLEFRYQFRPIESVPFPVDHIK